MDQVGSECWNPSGSIEQGEQGFLPYKGTSCEQCAATVTFAFIYTGSYVLLMALGVADM